MAHRGISHGLSRSPDRAETENTLLLMPVSYVLECLTVYLHLSSPLPSPSVLQLNGQEDKRPWQQNKTAERNKGKGSSNYQE